MRSILWFLQLAVVATPGCDTPAERRQSVLTLAQQAEHRGQPYEAIRILQEGLAMDPQCLPFTLRILDIRLDLSDCAASRALLPQAGQSRDFPVYSARVDMVCGDWQPALKHAWLQGVGRHPALLRQIARLRIKDARQAYALVKLLSTVRDEQDTTTLQAWLGALPPLSWSLKSYLDVAGLLSEARRDQEGPP